MRSRPPVRLARARASLSLSGQRADSLAEEIAALERIGGVVVTLGTTILRSETAAVVFSALVVHELGGLGNSS